MDSEGYKNEILTRNDEDLGKVDKTDEISNYTVIKDLQKVIDFVTVNEIFIASPDFYNSAGFEPCVQYGNLKSNDVC